MINNKDMRQALYDYKQDIVKRLETVGVCVTDLELEAISSGLINIRIYGFIQKEDLKEWKVKNGYTI